MVREDKKLLGLPDSASEEVVQDAALNLVDSIIAKKALKDKAVVRTQAQQVEKITGKEANVAMADSSRFSSGSYPYLEQEDRAFAQCFRLSEDDFLKLSGGLKNYTIHRLNRAKARQASITAGEETKTFSVPKLPSNIEEAVGQIKVKEITEDQWAKYLLNEHMTKVAGIIDALKAHDNIQKTMDTQREQEAYRERQFKAARRVEFANRYLVSENSQSAKDYADQQWEIERRKQVG